MKKIIVAVAVGLTLLLSGCETSGVYYPTHSQFNDLYVTTGDRIGRSEITRSQAFQILLDDALNRYPNDSQLHSALMNCRHFALQFERGEISVAEYDQRWKAEIERINQIANARQQELQNARMGAMMGMGAMQQQQQQMYRPAQPVNCVTTGHGRHAYTNCY